MSVMETGFGPEAYDAALSRKFTIPEARGVVCRATGVVNDRVDIAGPHYPYLVDGLQIAHDICVRESAREDTGDVRITFAEIANSATVGILEMHGSDRLPVVPANSEFDSLQRSDAAADMLRGAFLLALSERQFE